MSDRISNALITVTAGMLLGSGHAATVYRAAPCRCDRSRFAGAKYLSLSDRQWMN